MISSKILFVVTEDWYFCSHRLPLAIAAKEAGHDVAVATRISTHREIIEQAGIRVVPLRCMNRSSLNILRELASLLELHAIYRRERPDLVHHVALKPVIYGSMAARLTGIRARVNALGGLGFVFLSQKRLARVLRPLLAAAFRFIFNDSRSRLILQNEDDLAVVTEKAGVDGRKVHLIRGAGVDLKRYAVQPPPAGTPIVMLASRMLWDKGVGEFVEAARILKAQGMDARFVLVGEPDAGNPTSVPEDVLRKWDASGDVEWWGYRSDMPETLSSASVVCLPSYYEGTPKVLLEAMSCARPIVTTDTPGCRDLVRSGKNGLKVKPKDSEDLAMAMKSLLLDAAMRREMGIAGRRIAEEEYGLARVIAETMAVYQDLLD